MVQVLPPSPVLTMVPDAPTAIHMLAVGQLKAKRRPVAGEPELDHVAPPSRVATMVPPVPVNGLPPTATQTAGVGQLTLEREALVSVFCLVHVLPPSVVPRMRLLGNAAEGGAPTATQVVRLTQ